LQDGSSHLVKHTPRIAESWSFLAAGALAAFYLVTSVYIASQRLLRFDELLTVHVARLSNWATICAALAHGADGQPPIFYMVVGIFDKLFGHSEVTMRLPSALAMMAGLLITFDCARRLTDGLHGLIALSVLTFLSCFSKVTTRGLTPSISCGPRWPCGCGPTPEMAACFQQCPSGRYFFWE